jgi:hypothetical protein
MLVELIQLRWWNLSSYVGGTYPAMLVELIQLYWWTLSEELYSPGSGFLGIGGQLISNKT